VRFRRTRSIVRSSQLEQVLTVFIEQASQYLQEELAGGAEVPFELTSTSGRGHRTPLYSYRPLTADFLEERSAALRRLDGYMQAASTIAGAQGLERYLLSRGIARLPVTSSKCAEAALLVLLADVFAEQTDFELRPERMRAALSSLGDTASARHDEVTVLATLHGMTLSTPELALTTGLSLLRSDAFGGAPETFTEDVEDQPHLLVLFTSNDADVHSAITQGREILRDLLRALRLFGDGRLAFGDFAWTRIGDGSWSPLALGASGRPRGMLVITPEQEDELRAFCNLVSRRAPHDNELAWALRRFELGCERSEEHEALSDYLLGLRALLSRTGAEDRSEELLAMRLAALCAQPESRRSLAQRVIEAFELERSVIAGTAVPSASANALANMVGDHLRALLRDVICGHLDPGLIVLADELLAEERQPEQAPVHNEIAQALGIPHDQPQIAEQPSGSTAEFSAVPSQESLWFADAEEPVGAPV
jgi:hypothetical protein